LSSFGEAYVQFDQANLLALKLYRQPVPPPLIHDYDVPILLVDHARLENIPWDITAHRILPYINGRSCVRKIAMEAEVDLQSAKRCLRVLLFYQSVLPLVDLTRPDLTADAF
jgi:nitrogen permease regulator 2-like protein